VRLRPARPLRRAWLGPLLLFALAVSLALGFAGAAAGPAEASLPVVRPDSLDARPDGFTVTPREALATADAQRAVIEARRNTPSLRARVVVPQYFGDTRYEVIYLDGRRVVVDVHVDGVSGRLLELWTGPQADTLLARGYEPSVARSLNAWYVWIPLALLFVAPFVDLRRPWRLLHLDLAVLLLFGVSQYFFNRGQIDLSVPIATLLLVYLVGRLLLAGFRPRRASGPLVPLLPISALLVGLVLLVGFRVTLNAVDSHVIDVGYASVFGADRVERGEDLYQRGGELDDTYGPVTYLAYVPFEVLFPSDGSSGYRAAARAAAVTFDLIVVMGLVLLGARLRRGRAGVRLGIALAYAWAAYPFSLYALQTNTNDALVAALIVFAFIALSSPPLRGFLLGLAGAAKFAPLALAPLLMAGRRLVTRDALVFTSVAAVTVSVAVLGNLPDGGLREFWDATLGYQLSRASPFSLWGLHPGLGWLQTVVKGCAVLLVLLVALRPRERELRQLVALGAAVLIAVQLGAAYWFYTYIVWFAPLVLAALMAAYAAEPSARVPNRVGRGWRRSSSSACTTPAAPR
jgi:Glycosyltransferase family 87